MRADLVGELGALVRDIERDRVAHEAQWSRIVEVEISTDLADAPADVYAEIVTAYVDPFSLEGCP